MKIIEGLKKTKDLLRKADDIRSKIAQFCADLEIETPAYGDVEKQTKQIAEWLQSHGDIIKEIESLRLRIQRTNLAKEWPIEIADGKTVTKCITAWIHRRKDLAKADMACWAGLTNKGLHPQAYKKKDKDEEISMANVRKYYDQKTRDTKVEEYASEISRIDGGLEVANATLDLLD